MTNDVFATRRTLALAMRPRETDAELEAASTVAQLRDVLTRQARQIERLESRVRALEAAL